MDGAYRTLVKAEKRMREIRKLDVRYTVAIDFKKLVHDTEQSVRLVKNSEPFSPFPIALTSVSLQRSVEELASSMNLLPVGSDAVIHKHMLRDRSDILAEREKKKRRH
ncbi:hypothetical protein MHZ92_02525 [Sporosarcina sp. ACRSL]|nr:hypothetical protein [Sporosarcina sp. ACRSL]